MLHKLFVLLKTAKSSVLMHFSFRKLTQHLLSGKRYLAIFRSVRSTFIADSQILIYMP